jgi:SAM-dependent methyltransferase
MGTSIIEELDTEGLRANFLQYTRQAYRLIPTVNRPRILDVGCGTGLPTVELAHLSDGEIVAVDPDQEAIKTLRRRIESEGLGNRVRTTCCSIFETDFDAGSFEIIWEEGVFHLLDPDRVLTECARLLKLEGFLVMFETNGWFAWNDDQIREHGFEPFQRVTLPPGSWWKLYYEPLEQRVARLRGECRDADGREILGRFEREIKVVKSDVARSDSSFMVNRRRV